jgi:hypothetical protein
MSWKKLLAYITGSVDRELLTQNAVRRCQHWPFAAASGMLPCPCIAVLTAHPWLLTPSLSLPSPLLPEAHTVCQCLSSEMT